MISKLDKLMMLQDEVKIAKNLLKIMVQKIWVMYILQLITWKREFLT